MENFSYQYPVPELAESFEADFINSIKLLKRPLYISCDLIVSGFILFGIYTFYSSFFLLITAIAFIFIGFISARASVRNCSPSKLAISADSEKAVLTYYTCGQYFKRVLILYYDDVIMAAFTDKTHTGFQIIFNNNRSELKSYDKTGSEIPNKSDKLLVFDIAPMSCEQGFFLYYAPYLFNISGYAVTDNIIKKYGNSNEYFNKINGKRR